MCFVRGELSIGAPFCARSHPLRKENKWRSHATKIVYKAYLSRWIRPHWQEHELAEHRP